MKQGFATRAIHAGQDPEGLTGAVTVPLFQTSTYAQTAVGQHKGFEYARTHNPTRLAWENNIAALEGGAQGVAFSSGMATLDSIMKLFARGDHIVASEDMYGGTFRLFDKVYRRFGLEFSYIDMTDPTRLADALQSSTKMVFTESPTNPMMSVIDIEAVAGLCKAHNALLVVDNTFMTPYLQRPLELGADIVMHSVTKYLGGHSDLVGGVAVTGSDELAEELKFVQNAAGAVPGPLDCWLCLRSSKTLALRMRQHDENARAVAEMCNEHPKIEKTLYPGLPSHPQHELARRQSSGFGGMISIELGSEERAHTFAERLKIFLLAESLGGVESLVNHPASMTHGSVPPETRRRLGISDGLIRLSVGIEDKADLLRDIEQALDAI